MAEAGRYLKVQLAGDRLTARLRVEPGCPGSLLDEPIVLGELHSKGVVDRWIDAEALAGLLDSAPEAAEAVEAVVARGREPARGSDGEFRLVPDLARRVEEAEAMRRAAEDPRWVAEQQAKAEASDEDIDHYQRSPFVVVKSGEAVGELTGPGEGSDGEDVTGRSIAARRGHEAPIEIHKESVRVDSVGRVYARIEGRLITGRRLAVESVLRVPGSVDFSTGHIHFPGAVEIEGGVCDRFRVHSSRHLTVGGLVEAADVRAEGSLELRTGAAGRGKGEIRVARHLDARYLDGCEVVVFGDCRVDREINNCRLVVEGRFDAPRAVIRGGELFLSGSGEVSQLGGEGGIQTRVRLGVLDELQDLAREASAVLPELREASRRATEKLETFAAATSKLTASQAEEYTELQFEVAETDRMLAETQAAVEKLLGVYETHVRSELRVRTTIHGGTTVLVSGYRIEVLNSLPGPLLLRVASSGKPELVQESSGEVYRGPAVRMVIDPASVNVAALRKPA